MLTGNEVHPVEGVLIGLRPWLECRRKPRRLWVLNNAVLLFDEGHPLFLIILFVFLAKKLLQKNAVLIGNEVQTVEGVLIGLRP